MLKRLGQLPETRESTQKLPEERGFLAVLGRNRNDFRQWAGSKFFFSSLLRSAKLGSYARSAIADIHYIVEQQILFVLDLLPKVMKDIAGVQHPQRLAIGINDGDVS